MSACFICSSSSWYTWNSASSIQTLVGRSGVVWRNSSKKAARILFVFTSSKSWVLTNLWGLNMLPSSTCISSPSKSSSSSSFSSSSAIWRFHCFIHHLCSWWFLTWWQVSRCLGWWWSCSLLIHGFTNLEVSVWQYKELLSYTKFVQVGAIRKK